MRNRLLLLAVAALAVVPFLAGPMRGQDKKGTDYPSEWFPLKVGATKVYLGSDGKERSTVSVEKAENFRWKLKDKTSDLIVGYALKTTSGDKMLIEDVFVAPDGIYRRSAAGKEINPPIRILKLPPKEGDTWNVDSESESVRLVGSFSVEKATIDLPGRGPTETFLVTANDFYAGKEKIDMKTWFAYNLGIVKQHVKVSKFELSMEMAGPNTPAPPPVPAAKIDPKKAFPSAPPAIVAPPAGSVPAAPPDTLRPAPPMPPPGPAGLPKLPEIPTIPAPPPPTK
jgi:hypothetical protein